MKLFKKKRNKSRLFSPLTPILHRTPVKRRKDPADSVAGSSDKKWVINSAISHSPGMWKSGVRRV